MWNSIGEEVGADASGIPAVVELVHELRTPLAALVAALELADDPAALNAARSAATHIAAVVTRAEAVVGPQDAVADTEVDMPSVAMSTVEALTPLFSARTVAVTVEVSDGLPLIASGDPVAVARIAANLLGNASRYAPVGGRVVVEVTREGAWVHMTVTDDGPGLGANSPGGWGIGLAVSDRMAKEMGGSLAPMMCTTGACFRLTLPALGD